MKKRATQFVFVALGASLLASPAFGTVQTCPATSGPQDWTGGTLDTGTTRSGTTYSSTGGSHLELNPAASVFKSTPLGTSDFTLSVAVADFDKDGWDDFVGATSGTTTKISIYENHTSMNAAPNWNNVNLTRAAKFDNVRDVATGFATAGILTAADFNGDTWPDIFLTNNPNDSVAPTFASVYLNTGVLDVNGYPNFSAGYTAMNNNAPNASTFASLGLMSWTTSNLVPYDWNGDRKMDILVGSGTNGGEIRVLLNQCTPAASGQPAAPAMLKCATGSNPTFKFTNTLITGLGFSATHGEATFAYGKIDNDAFPDLVVGAPTVGTLRYFPGIAGGLVDTANVKTITFVGAATGVFIGDFSQDGKVDLVVSSDNWNYLSGTLGGMSHYWINNGTSNPFGSVTPTKLTNHGAPSNDFDAGFILDYDHDPHNTLDVMLSDGNDSQSYYILANRSVSQYVNCGDVASGVMPLGTLSSSEMVVTAARIHPTQTLNGGTITYYLTNEVPPNWVQATSCGDGTGDLCATFPRSSGRDVQWKATMCSDSTHTQTPTITGMQAKFVYTTATEHYRSGVIVNDGISYVGAFREPGDRGKFYATNAALNHTYWDAAAKIDAATDTSRNIYTADSSTGGRLAFSHSGTTVAAGLVSTLGASTSTQAISVIDWVRSARFGVGNTGIALSKLGAVETSTPAVLIKPGLPTWYVFATLDQRNKVDAFLLAQTQRRSLALFGSKDGMVHAINTLPADINNTLNGKEAWAYIPPGIASGMLADYSTSLNSTLSISSYPDGSPTLADVADSSGNMSTIAIIGGGNGGKSVAAIDVTSTINPSNGVVSGPTPLWSKVPGGSNAGQANSKVAVARVKIAGAQRFIAVAGTGIDFTDNTVPYQRGRVIEAYDVLTGALLWKFQMKCPLTSDITVFETDDDLESGAPLIDGYADRAVFADKCGYVYKVDPAKNLNGAYNGNAGMGTITADLVGAVQEYALFSTKFSTGALGSDSPIAGTLGAQVEASSSRLVLFFGTGGLESHPTSSQNQFYAVYADNGSIHSKITGTCTSGHCEKFYGGVVASQQQVFLTRTVDPVVGSSTCDRGTTVVQAVELNQLDGSGEFITDFTRTINAAVMGALYGDAGALYFATLAGDVVRIGQPRAPDAGGDSAAGAGTASGTGSGTGVSDVDTPMTLYGWRQVF